MKIRDRIKELRRVKASELRPNPKNWRTHPQEQQDALRGVLAEIGYADALIAREVEGGGLELIDGHLRAETTPDEIVPVLVLDLTKKEADKLLATLDPLAAMAEANAAALEKLLGEIETDSQAVQEMLDGLAKDSGIEQAASEPVDNTYTNKIVLPIYEPKGEQPPLTDLIDRDKTLSLTADIDKADLPNDVKYFLRLAAERHTVFNFRQIAEFYCHANATLKELMERSGLVIIDFNKAIEYGFVHLTERLGQLADLEEADYDDA